MKIKIQLTVETELFVPDHECGMLVCPKCEEAAGRAFYASSGVVTVYDRTNRDYPMDVKNVIVKWGVSR